jgi:sugar lactone lactonase YvrE
MSTIKVDTITDEAGTGAPTFSQGAAVTGNLSATGTIAGGAFSGSGAGLTGVPSSAVTGLTPTFNPVAVTGNTPTLNVGSYNFFDNGVLTSDTTISFSNVPTNARWSYSAVASVATGAGDLSTATFIRTRSVSSEETSPRSLFFKPDGRKMYIIGITDDEVVEYNLSTAWDVSTATYLQAYSVAAKELSPRSLFFSADGTRMYTMGATDNAVDQYSLSTAWDVTSASWVREFSTSSQDTSSRGVYFKTDGTKMFICGTADSAVVEYALSTAWDISTASYTQEFSVLAQDSSVHDLHFNSDGTTLYIVGPTTNRAYQYTLTTAWDVSTASYANKSVDVSVYAGNVQGMYISPEGGYFYFTGNNDRQVTQYSLGTPTVINFPSSVENPAGAGLLVNKRVTYEFFTMDSGTTVKVIGEEMV